MTIQRNVYLKMKPLEEARNILFDHFGRIGAQDCEILPVPDAVGRVLAEAVTAAISSPHFHSAAMDGIAVRAKNTFGANQARPITLAVGEEAVYVNTGHVMPRGCDAVIMIENVNVIDDDRVEIEAPAFPWQNVRKVGEDIVATELLFARNHTVTPYCVGALLSGGVFSVNVRKKPKLLIIPTGSELVDWQTAPEDLKPGRIFETNSFVLGKLAEACGGSYVRHPKVVDDVGQIRAAVREAVRGDFDMVLTVGGSSAGSEDFARPVIADLGEVLVHGVTIMPGKPLLIGDVSGKPVFGIPGYPVSAIIAFEQFVRPLIQKMLGQPETERQRVMAQPTRKIASKLGVEEFVRVKLGNVGERIMATPLPRAAGCITSITEADGILRIPNHMEGIRGDDTAEVELLRPLASVDNTIVIVGSHDNSLDVLADQIKARQSRLTLSSSHVGSMGGLIALRKGACHLAGSHLLDTEDGSYNVSYVRRYLPGRKVRLVNLVLRDQGLIVLPGNPKGIRGIEDLGRPDVTFINRQGGSGTRILLDYRLRQLGMNPGSITGYDIEEFTHMSVAVAVLSGTVDVGLGIYAAAKALGLEFVPVVTEQYDLVIPDSQFESALIRTLLDIINTRVFRERVEALGGYSTEKTGTLTTIETGGTR